MERVVIKADGITLDLLLWRRYGAAGQSLVGEALGLNVGLGGLGVMIPAGTEVLLPDLPVASKTAVVPVDLFS